MQWEGTRYTLRHIARYVDEQGNLIAEIWRYEEDAPAPGRKPSKLIRPRAPLPDGKWIGTLDGRALPLYHLPQVLESPFEAVIFVTEGEKKADQLQSALDSAGVAATVVCAAGGAGKWQRAEDAEAILAGRRVVSLPDNDDSGRRHAEQVRDGVIGSATDVRIVRLPGLGEKEDIADWLEREGTIADLMQLVDATGPELIPLDEPDEPDAPAVAQAAELIEQFPVEALPVGVRTFVQETALALNCAPDLVAIPALVALSVAIGTSRAIEVKPGRVVFPTLYAAIIAKPGEAKTPALSAALQPLNDADRRAYRQWRNDIRAWEQIGEAPGADRGPRPLFCQTVVSDTTMEALTDVLQANPRGVVVQRDELSGWVRSMDQYRGGRGADRQHWLSMWSNEPLIVNRRGDGVEPRRIERPFASVIGGIQPSMLSELVDKQGREDGFLHRFLFSWPRSMPRRWSNRYVSDEVKTQYGVIVSRLLALTPRADDRDADGEESEGGGGHSPISLPFTANAQHIWAEWYNGHFLEPEVTSLAEDYLSGPWAKLEAYAPRLALILHLARIADGDPTAGGMCVDEESLTAALAIVEYFKSHVRRVYALLHAHPEDLQFATFLTWLQKQPGIVVTARQVQQAHLSGVRSAGDAKELLLKAEERGYGKTQEARSQRGRPSFQFVRERV